MDPFAPFTPKNTANPLLGGQKGASPKAPASKTPPKAAPPKAAPVKAPVAKTPLSPFSPKLPSTPLPGSSAVQRGLREGAAHPNPPTHHSLFSLHTLESGAQDVGNFAGKAFRDTYGGKKGTKGGAEAGRAAPGAAIATPINPGPFVAGMGTATKNLPGSTARLVTGIIPGTIDTAKAGVEAAAGKPAALEQVGKGLGQMLLHPIKYAEHEPASALLMAGGAEAAAGTAVGDVARSGALGDRAAEAGSTVRPDLELYNGETIPREYSPDIIRKGAQVAADKFREKVLNDPNVNQATGTRLNRHLYGGGLLGQFADRLGIGRSAVKFQGLVKPGIVDKAQGAFTDIRKMYSNAADKTMHDIKGSLPKGAEQAVPLAVEGTIRTAETAKADLESRLAALQHEAENLSGNEARLNKAQQAQITKLLANKQLMADPSSVIQAAKTFADHQQPLVDRKVQVGALEPDQVHAKYVPYATQHMGAEYNANPGPHPLVAEISGLTREAEKARQDVKTAQGQLENARAPSPRVAVDHPVARTRQALKDAELSKARSDERLAGSGLKSLGIKPHVTDAKAAYAKAKADLESHHQAKVTAVQAHLADTRGSLLKAKETLGYLKDNGAIKANGDMYPRLELGGKPLFTEDIQAHARQALGDREIGFLTHKEGSWGSAAHARSGVRPAIERRSRTGVAYKTGTYDSSWDALKRQAYKDAQDVAGHDSRDDMVRRFGIGSYHDQATAQQAADNFNHSPEGKVLTGGLGPVEVVHAGPDRVMNRANMPSAVATDTMKDFGVAEHKAITELGPEGKYRLMPKAVADRIEQHDKLNERGGFASVMQALTNKFRSTGLYTNPHWPVGIAQENMIRLAFANVNPFAVFKVGAAAKLGDDLAQHFRTIAADPAATEAQRFAAKAQVAAIDQGSQYGSLVNSAVFRPLGSQLPEGFQTFTDALSAKAPASQVLRAWEGWKNTVGNGVERLKVPGIHTMGTNARKAMLGKAALDETRKFSGEWKALLTRQNRAVKAYAESKLTPSAAAKLGDDIMRMAGNWSHLTPAVRSMTQTVAPFDLWWLNSMKFIFKTLPVDHPFKSAALAAMASATGATKGNPKAEYLDGGVGVKLPIVGNVTAEVSKYSPFGVGVEPPETALGIFGAPVIASPVEAGLGLNPFTQKPEISSFGPARGVESLAEETIPGIRPAEAILRRGGEENPASVNPIATKPGTQTGLLPALAKELTPVPFIVNRSKDSGVRERAVRERPIRERAARAVIERPVRERPVRER